ncbi:MAG: glycerophosphodiester phosphodiesterase [Actinomycetota bacterium]
MKWRLLGVTVAATIGIGAAAPAPALLEPNPWLGRRVLHIAHQGGENEYPSNTMYAYRSSVELFDTDVVELDVHATADGQIVAIHDATVDRTTNGTGRIDQMTLAQVQALDAAYWFVPGYGTTHSRPPSEYIYRGVATGQTAPPPGFTVADFRIPTLHEVLQRYPDRFINIEIKATVPDTTPYEDKLAALLREFGRDDDVIVVSFLDHAVELFKVWAPEIHTATATVETAAFYATAYDALPGAPNPRYVAMQVPMVFEGITVLTEDFVANAHANGLAVHAWTIDDPDDMCDLIAMGVDGIMTNEPSDLRDILDNGCD